MMKKKQGSYIIGFQGRDYKNKYIIYVIEHKHTNIDTEQNRLLVRATEKNNYTKSILILGKVEFQKNFLK